MAQLCQVIDLISPETSQSSRDVGIVSGLYALSPYAHKYWAHHLRACESQDRASSLSTYVREQRGLVLRRLQTEIDRQRDSGDVSREVTPSRRQYDLRFGIAGLGKSGVNHDPVFH
jgi:hypothetical protein